jgi:hypothetical protein
VAGASLLAHDAVSGPVPCSGARRQDKTLDEVSAAILGDAVAENPEFTGSVSDPVERLVGRFSGLAIRTINVNPNDALSRDIYLVDLSRLQTGASRKITIPVPSAMSAAKSQQGEVPHGTVGTPVVSTPLLDITVTCVLSSNPFELIYLGG